MKPPHVEFSIHLPSTGIDACHENIGLPHRKHLYQLMANELKIPHVVVSLIYMMSQAVIIVGYLLIPGNGYCYLMGAIIVLSVVYVLFMKKYFHLHQMTE